jgi:CRISPR/Cas system-associated exonuclease Cas4 (RecB family)
MAKITASEIGSYLYCRRAWWYKRQGVESANQGEMAVGTEIHRQHGQKVFLSGIYRGLAVILFLIGLVFLVAQCTTWVIQ